jgi:glycosyltransferase involved in cell wall biosynthesis
MNELVSIVIPVFNAQKHIENTINSVLKQTYSNWELIIIDDCSTDNSFSIVRNKYNDSDKIRIIKLDNNSGGPAKPRNIGIRNSNGEFIAFLDQDDIWDTNKLSQILNYLTCDNKIDVVCHDERLRIMGKSTNVILHHGPYDKNFYKEMLISGNRLSTSATCVRTSFLINNNIYFNESSDYVIVEDYDLWLRLASQGAVFKFINQPLGEYAIQNKSISLNIKRARYNLEILLKNHVNYTQTFFDNKNRLWGIVSFRLLISDIRSKYKNKFLFLEVFMYSRLIIRRPIGAIFYIRSFFKRRLRSHFLDFKTWKAR